jgi:hypothetical protein
MIYAAAILLTALGWLFAGASGQNATLNKSREDSVPAVVISLACHAAALALLIWGQA